MSKRAKTKQKATRQPDKPVGSPKPIAGSEKPTSTPEPPWWRVPAWLALIVSVLGLAVLVYKEIIKPLAEPSACEQTTSVSGQKMRLELTGRLSFELGEFNHGRLLEVATQTQRIPVNTASMSLTHLEVSAGAPVSLTLKSTAEGENQTLHLETTPPEALAASIDDSGIRRGLAGPIQLSIRGLEPLKLFGELAEPAALGLDSLEACWRRPQVKSLVVEKGTLRATRVAR